MDDIAASLPHCSALLIKVPEMKTVCGAPEQQSFLWQAEKKCVSNAMLPTESETVNRRMGSLAR